MDIHCKFCGEPWDHDELHDMLTPESLSKNGQPLPYKEAAALFQARLERSKQTLEKTIQPYAELPWLTQTRRRGRKLRISYLMILMTGCNSNVSRYRDTN